MPVRATNSRYDLALRRDVDKDVEKITAMVRQLAADEQARREALAREAATAYQAALEALRMTNDSMARIATDQLAADNQLAERIQWLERRTLPGRLRRVRHWIRVHWSRLTIRTIDHD